MTDKHFEKHINRVPEFEGIVNDLGGSWRVLIGQLAGGKLGWERELGSEGIGVWGHRLCLYD